MERRLTILLRCGHRVASVCRKRTHFSYPLFALSRRSRSSTKLCCRWIVATTTTQAPIVGSKTSNPLCSMRSMRCRTQAVHAVMASNDCRRKDRGMVCRKLRSRMDSRNGWFKIQGMARYTNWRNSHGPQKSRRCSSSARLWLWKRFAWYRNFNGTRLSKSVCQYVTME